MYHVAVRMIRHVCGSVAFHRTSSRSSSSSSSSSVCIPVYVAGVFFRSVDTTVRVGVVVWTMVIAVGMVDSVVIVVSIVVVGVDDDDIVNGIATTVA